VFRHQCKYFRESLAHSSNTRSILSTTRIDYVSGFRCSVLGTRDEIFSRHFIQFRDEEEHPINKALSGYASRAAALIVRKEGENRIMVFPHLGRRGNIKKLKVNSKFCKIFKSSAAVIIRKLIAHQHEMSVKYCVI